MRTRLALRRVLVRALGATPGTQQRNNSEFGAADPVVLVGLSGGADSLALAAALAAEARALGVRGGAIVVDHGLQHGSNAIAEHAASQATALGLHPVLVRRVVVDPAHQGGPESAARAARYAVFVDVATAVGASAILTAHTRDDQAEQVLLALARGSGTRSIAGIPVVRPLSETAGVSGTAAHAVLLRPFLEPSLDITRAMTEAACAELGLEPWNDPHNTDRTYARVRVRQDLLPAIERALGGGVRAGLARSADLAREDAEALDEWAAAVCETARRHPAGHDAGVEELNIAALAEVPAAVRQRVIHRVAAMQFGASLGREHTLAIAGLVTDWRGQGPIFAPGIRATRVGGALLLERQLNSPRKAQK